MSSKIQQLFNNAMTVADLIAELEELPQDAKVVFASNYGDITNTTQVTAVDDVCELGPEYYLEETAYSNSGVCVEELDENELEEIDELQCEDDYDYEEAVKEVTGFDPEAYPIVVLNLM